MDKKFKDSSSVLSAQQKPKKKSSAPMASQHTDKKHKDSSDPRGGGVTLKCPCIHRLGPCFLVQNFDF